MQAVPRFVHDCNNPNCCKFVGNTLHYDVYYTVRDGGLAMRNGNRWSSYRSYLTLAHACLVAEVDAQVFQAVQLVEAWQKSC